MKVADIINLAGHDIMSVIENAQYKILSDTDSRPDARIEGIIKLHEIQRKFHRDINIAITYFDEIPVET